MLRDLPLIIFGLAVLGATVWFVSIPLGWWVLENTRDYIGVASAPLAFLCGAIPPVIMEVLVMQFFGPKRGGDS